MKRRLGFVSNSSSCSFIIDADNLNKIKEATIDYNYVERWASECANDELQYSYYKDKTFTELYNMFKDKYIYQFNALQEDVNNNEFKECHNVLHNYKYDQETRYIYKNKEPNISDYFSLFEIGHYFKSVNNINKHLYYNLYAEFLKILKHRSFKSLYSWILACELQQDNIIYVGRMWNRDKSPFDMINRNRLRNKRINQSIMKFNKINRYNNRIKFKYIIRYLISQDFHLSGYWSSNIDSLLRKNDNNLSDIIKFVKLYKKLLTPLCHNLYKIIENDIKDSTFYTKEYSDGGGCGDTLPLAECGLLFDDLNIKYNKISNH